MAKYDVESLLADVKTIISANFNSKIAAINLEKNDSIALDQLDAGAYFLQQLNGRMANYNPICLYGVENIESSSRGPLSSKKIEISVIIIAADSGEEVEIGARMFRYQRALEEIFQEKWNGGSHPVKFEIRSLVPIPFQDMNTSNSYRAIGLVLEGNLG